jgi:hypothetical protein
MAKTLIITVFSLFFTAFVAVVADPFIKAVFDLLGWDTGTLAPPFVRNVLRLTSFIGSPTVVSFMTYMAVFVVGVWLHWLAVQMDRKRPSKADKFASLSNKIRNVRNELFDSLKDKSGLVDFNSRSRRSDLRLSALYAELRPLGLSPPDYDAYDNMAFNSGHISYLEVLEPSAETGNLVEAKRQVKLDIAEFKAIWAESHLPLP